MSLVIPLYYGPRHTGGQLIETDNFCLQEQPTNEVFNGRPALFDMFNIVPLTKQKDISFFRMAVILFVGDSPLQTNAYNLAAHLILFRRPVERALS